MERMPPWHRWPEKARHTMDENTRREKARKAIHARRIPNRPPDRMWGGPGSGAACVVCDQTLGEGEVGFEVEFAPTDAKPRQNYHLHVRCFAAWELERESDYPLPAANGAGTISDRERDSPYRGST